MLSEPIAVPRGKVLPRKSYSHLHEAVEVPNLIEVQTNSYRWLMEEGIKELLEEISPIKDLTGNKMELEFLGYEIREPHYSQEECVERDLTYTAPLYVKVRLLIKTTGEIKEPANVFFGDFPLMTDKGTFIINGTERVAVSQLMRSPGVYFTLEEDPTTRRQLCFASLIPTHGAWLDFETSAHDVISVKIDRRRKVAITTFLRAIGYSSDEELLTIFSDVDKNPEHQFIRSTIEKEPDIRDEVSALRDIYRRLRPGDMPNLESARKLLDSMFFDARHYDLGSVGRYKINQKLGLDTGEDRRALTKEDVVGIVKHMILVNNGLETPDDIDHLGNRRIRTVGDLVQNQLRIGIARMERIVKERMSIITADSATPAALLNIHPVAAALREFFSGSQLSQFMDQTNPLAELTHKRRLSAMGPGGLSRERAGFEVRDVHYSHYGRICPIETPEGPNIGLIGSLAIFARINRFGFIETPYRKVLKSLPNNSPKLAGRRAKEAIKDKKGTTIVEAGERISAKAAASISKLSAKLIEVYPFASDEIVYLSADIEDKYTIAQANTRLDENGEFLDDKIEARSWDNYIIVPPESIDYMDVSPKQLFSVAAALIPFLEHDDANRALMGANMQRQAVPLLKAEAPLVGTGIETDVAKYSGQLLLATNAGQVTSVTSSQIVVTRENGQDDIYKLQKFIRTNQGTCINQRPTVKKGDIVSTGQPLADSYSTRNGELALGQNAICAFMSWKGYNFEDAVIISSRLVEDDKLASIHIFKYEVEARNTKLGDEEITRDIPNIGEEGLHNLDEDGIIRISAEVGPGDILVGKVTPKGETELSPEEKLLRAIFGEKAGDVKDTSLRMPHGEWGKVIAVKVFDRDKGDELGAKVNKRVQVWVAQKRRVSVGDKLAGRHGNKGVISIIVPVEDMPILPDGTPIDIILNPIGVPSRMNLGQILETHLGWAAENLGFQAITPIFDGATEEDIEDGLARVWLVGKATKMGYIDSSDEPSQKIEKTMKWLNELGYDAGSIFYGDSHSPAIDTCLKLWLEEIGIDGNSLPQGDELKELANKLAREKNVPSPLSGKVILRDGSSGEPFEQPITVGIMYMMKLIHLVEDKVHARATGPYSLISQQPLGGKAQFGGQRFGEMEVWALEAYGAAFNLQEMLTVKSDDITGRSKTYEAIVKGEDIMPPGVPESFKVLVKELQSLGLAVEVLKEEEKPALSSAENKPPEDTSDSHAAAE